MVDITKNKTETQEAKNPKSNEKFPLNKWLYGAGVSTVGLLQWTVVIFAVMFPLTYWGRDKSEKIDKAITWVEKSYEKLKNSHSTDHLKTKGNIGTALALSLPISWLFGHLGMLSSSVDGYKQAQAAETKFDNMANQVTVLKEENDKLNVELAKMRDNSPSHITQLINRKSASEAQDKFIS